MDLILIVHPDRVQASSLQSRLREIAHAEVHVVDSKEAALAVIDEHIPDVLLLHDLISPAEEEHLIAYLSALPATTHVQAISIPVLKSVPECEGLAGFLFRNRPRRSPKNETAGCDPDQFAADVVRYLNRARAIKSPIDAAGAGAPSSALDRRRAYRWSRLDVPWLSSVRLPAGESADLINISSGGSLVATHVRPELASLRRRAVDSRFPSALTFRLASGEEIRAAGRVIRCRPKTADQGHLVYEVAFRFDESVGFDLPGSAAFALDRDEADEYGDDLACDILNRTATVQNALLAGILDDDGLPVSVRNAVLELTRLNSALLEIRSTIDGARGPELRDLARALGHKVQELSIRRRRVVESLNPGDVALIGAYANRSRSLPVLRRDAFDHLTA